MTQLATINFTPPDDAVIAMWLHGRSPHTQRAYRHDVEALRSFVNRPLAEITLAQLQEFSDQLAMTDRSKQRVLAAVKSLFAFAHGLGYLPFDTAHALRIKQIDRSIKAERILTEDQVRAMCEAESGRNRVMLRFLYASGVRVSELTSLRWRDCTPLASGGVVTVTGKRNKTRAINIPDPVWSELMSLRGADSEDARPFGIHQSTVWHIVRRAARRANISKDVSTHWLRHACGTHAMQNGASIAVVQHQFGHASIATTGQYLHVLPTDGAGKYLRL